MNNGSIALSLVLLAAGAILTWAIDTSVRVTGLDLNAVGIILMAIGLLGMVLSLLFWASFAPFGQRDTRERHDPI